MSFTYYFIISVANAVCFTLSIKYGPSFLQENYATFCCARRWINKLVPKLVMGCSPTYGDILALKAVAFEVACITEWY
jgi:hypothetical protein